MQLERFRLYEVYESVYYHSLFGFACFSNGGSSHGGAPALHCSTQLQYSPVHEVQW